MINLKNLDVIYRNKYIALNVILIFLLLNSILVKAQSIEDVKKKDTVFILFQKSDRFLKKHTHKGVFLKNVLLRLYL